MHADTFDALGSRLIQSHPYGFTQKMEADGWYRVRWKQLAPIDPPLEQFALVFGDILYNLRASLDYIVWQLVEVNGATPTSSTSFPCVRDSMTS